MEEQTKNDIILFRVIQDFSPLRLKRGELIGFNYGLAIYKPDQTGKNLPLGLKWEELQELEKFGIVEEYGYDKSFPLTKTQKRIAEKLTEITPALEKCYRGGIFMSKHPEISLFGKHTRYSFRSIGALLARISEVNEEDVGKIFDGER